MSRPELPDTILDLFEGLESSPNEAAQRFAGLSRWMRRGRDRRSLETLRRELHVGLREETARVLGDASVALLYEDVKTRDLLHRCVRSRERLETPSVRGVRLDAGQLARSPVFDELATAEETRAIGDLRAGATSDRLELVLLSWRLCPLERTALQASIEYRLLGEWKSSQRFLEEVLRAPTSALKKSYANESLGALFLARGMAVEARDCFRAGAECGESRPTVVSSWLLTSVHLGDDGQADVAARVLEELAPDAFEIETTIRSYRELRRRGTFELRLDGRRTSRAFSTSEPAQRILHALS